MKRHIFIINVLAGLVSGSLIAACSSDSSSTPGADGGVDADSGIPLPDASPDRCSFVPEESQWLVEGETLSVQVSCGSGETLDDLEIPNLPTGATLDNATNTIEWTPGLDQAAVYQLQLRSSSLDGVANLQVGVADAYDNPSNQPIIDPTQYTMELGLPVVFIAAEPDNDYEFEPMQVTYGGVVHEAEAKLRGKSSLSYPKRSYALRFDKFDTFNETVFADFGNRRRVILTSTFDDNAYFRQRMAYDLWSQLQPTIKVEAYNVVVYRGTEYRGIYTATDHINADLLKRSGLSESGNLFKAENHDANFRLTANDGSDKDDLFQGYSKTEGDPGEDEPGAFDDMADLVSFVSTSNDQTFNAEIASRIDIDDYVAWWLHVTFMIADDSGGKNSYHYHDESRTWRVAPWDFNSSFGQSWETSRTDTDDYETFFRRNLLFERLLDHPTLGPEIRARYKATLESGVFTVANLHGMIDRYMAEIGMAAERDWQRWQSEYRGFDRWSWRAGSFTTHLEEVEYVRAWIAQRWDFVHDNY